MHAGQSRRIRNRPNGVTCVPPESPIAAFDVVARRIALVRPSEELRVGAPHLVAIARVQVMPRDRPSLRALDRPANPYDRAARIAQRREARAIVGGDDRTETLTA